MECSRFERPRLKRFRAKWAPVARRNASKQNESLRSVSIGTETALACQSPPECLITVIAARIEASEGSVIGGRLEVGPLDLAAA
jgi:hypothetical protein